MIREHEPMMNLFKTLVIPILDYGSVIWNPHKLKDIALLEKVQRNYTKRLQNLKELNYYERSKFLNIILNGVA